MVSDKDLDEYQSDADNDADDIDDNDFGGDVDSMQ